MERETFVFHKEWREATSGLPAEVRLEIYEAIIEYGISGRLTGSTSIDTGRVLYTITKGVERSTFDSRAFRKEHEDLYQQFMKKSTTAPSMKITIR